MNGKPNVFVVQETDKNIEPAKVYGNIRVLLTHKDVSAGAKHMSAIAKRGLSANLASEKDFLLCIGDPIAIGLVMHEFLRETGGKMTALKWNKQTYEYTKVEINI